MHAKHLIKEAQGRKFETSQPYHSGPGPENVLGDAGDRLVDASGRILNNIAENPWEAGGITLGSLVHGIIPPQSHIDHLNRWVRMTSKPASQRSLSNIYAKRGLPNLPPLPTPSVSIVSPTKKGREG